MTLYDLFSKLDLLDQIYLALAYMGGLLYAYDKIIPKILEWIWILLKFIWWIVSWPFKYIQEKRRSKEFKQRLETDKKNEEEQQQDFQRAILEAKIIQDQDPEKWKDEKWTK